MKEIKSFSFAIKGISVAIRDEAHIRFHLVATFYVFFFGINFQLTKVEWCVILLNIATVITAEMMNTAIENICNMHTREYNEDIKIIKDISAGGVLVCSVVALISGVIVFWDLPQIALLIDFYIHSPLALLELIFTLIISLLFIRKYPNYKLHKS